MRFCGTLFCVWLCLLVTGVRAEVLNESAETPPLLYRTPLEDISPEMPRIQPWRSIRLDDAYKGMWIVAGDVDGDGEAEILSARVHDIGDVHYTVSVVAHKLDGSVLWKWGRPEEGVFPLHSDVACQIYDWDGDSKNEVIVAADQAVVELDGATGSNDVASPSPRVLRTAWCSAICRAGRGPPTLLVKTRYTQIWAYDHEARQLWTVESPAVIAPRINLGRWTSTATARTRSWRV